MFVLLATKVIQLPLDSIVSVIVMVVAGVIVTTICLSGLFYKKGVKKGKTTGHIEHDLNGYGRGKQEGLAEGKSHGFRDGFAKGSKNGHAAGLVEGRKLGYQKGWDRCYEQLTFDHHKELIDYGIARFEINPKTGKTEFIKNLKPTDKPEPISVDKEMKDFLHELAKLDA